jgi:hypothetical protein
MIPNSPIKTEAIMFEQSKEFHRICFNYARQRTFKMFHSSTNGLADIGWAGN